MDTQTEPAAVLELVPLSELEDAAPATLEELRLELRAVAVKLDELCAAVSAIAASAETVTAQLSKGGLGGLMGLLTGRG